MNLFKYNDNIFGIAIVTMFFLAGFFTNSLFMKVHADKETESYKSLKAHRGQNRPRCNPSSNFTKINNF